MQPQPPENFCNPYEAEIIKLEKQYADAIARGAVFEDVKEIKSKIKQLRSELAMRRDKASGNDESTE